MADEPTGALDSVTGRAVFDTLKKLSETRLVIVVSHDREFAEFYGDRVIELKDGKVISDISKHSNEEMTPGLRFLGEKGIVIEKGYTLTEKYIDLINERLKNRAGSTLVSFDEEANSSLLHKGSLGNVQGSAAFNPTSEEDTKDAKENGEPFHLIKSRLPIKNSVKMAWKSLKVKPVKLAFTIILSSIALTFFGLSDTLVAYKKETALTNSIADSSIKAASFLKVSVPKNEEDYVSSSSMKTSDLKLINEKNGNGFLGVYPFKSYSSIDGVSGSMDYATYFIDNPKGDEPYWARRGSSFFTGFIPMDASTATDYGFTLASGAFPSSDKEILISKFVFNRFKYFGFKGTSVTINSADLTADETGATFLSKNPTISMGDSSGVLLELKITGIIDTDFDASPYSSLDKSTNDLRSYLVSDQLNSELSYNFSNILYASQEFYSNLVTSASYLAFSDCGITNGSFDVYGSGGSQEASLPLSRFGNIFKAQDMVYLDGATSLEKG